MPRMIYFYTKEKIEKAINNPLQFQKELKKACSALNFEELDTLKTWVNNVFKKQIDVDKKHNN